MEKPDILTFIDLDDGDETVVIVRAIPDGIGLSLSKKADGDLEVFMPVETAKKLADVLREVTD